MAIHSRAKTKLHHYARKLFRPRMLVAIALLLIALPAAFFIIHDDIWEFRNLSEAPLRNRAADKSGNAYPDAEYLKQGWSEGESEWFYTVTQGSDLLPYSFFLSLSFEGKPFNSDANFKRWRYIPQSASERNPDALPIGFVRNEYRKRSYLGLTCAACHTGQVTYHGKAWRIDGGPSMADFDGFMADLRSAVNETAKLDAAGHCATDGCKSFVSRVIERGDYKDELEVTRDLTASKNRIDCDAIANHSNTKYGFARLDAFGRIYNRVLSAVLRKEDLADIVRETFDSSELPAVRAALRPVLEGTETREVVERALPLLSAEQRKKLVAKIFNPSNAPVSYPFLWDTPQHDFVQWNGIVANATFGGVGRNAGEVIGVFGTLDWQIKDGWSLSSLLGGQGLKQHHISYESSIYVHNLRRIEAQIVKLQSPQWPSALPGIDATRAFRGEALFGKHCARCHAEINRDAPYRRIVASMIGSSLKKDLDKIGTDPTMARNSTHAMGYAGMLRNQYVNATGIGNVLIDRRAPVAALLTQATHGVIAEPYPNANPIRRVADWASDLVGNLLSNEIQSSLKSGDYTPDTTVSPYASLEAYKGRSLNGIWATAPYLHNGSVPTLYDLLLPTRHDGDPEGGEYRPTKFVVGSRELDPVKVGFLSAGYEGFEFDTTLPGNSNAGHEYGTIHDSGLKERELEPMTNDERLDLVEYLKTL